MWCFHRRARGDVHVFQHPNISRKAAHLQEGVKRKSEGAGSSRYSFWEKRMTCCMWWTINLSLPHQAMCINSLIFPIYMYYFQYTVCRINISVRFKCMYKILTLSSLSNQLRLSPQTFLVHPICKMISCKCRCNKAHISIELTGIRNIQYMKIFHNRSWTVFTNLILSYTHFMDSI